MTEPPAFVDIPEDDDPHIYMNGQAKDRMQRRLPQAVSGSEFIANPRVPEPVIDGLHHHGRVVALTAQTNHGKTALATLMQLCIANGMPFAGRSVEQGRVLVLAGENPDDYRLRLLATAQAMGLDPRAAVAHVLVMPGAFVLDATGLAHVQEQSGAFGPVAHVTVDTSVAFYGGKDENDAVSMRQHGANLRKLTDLSGYPAVMPLCHPTKGAQQDSLTPRGAGAFLAEVDGNHTLWKAGETATLHHHAKLRSAPFDPMRFAMVPQRLNGLTDSRGMSVYSVAAIPEEGISRSASRHDPDKDRAILIALRRTPGAPMTRLAGACGLKGNGGVSDRLERLQRDGMVRKENGHWVLTKYGEAAADEVRP